MVDGVLNVAELSAELDRKKARLQELAGERETLMNRLKFIDDEIELIVGVGGKFKVSRRRKRVKNEKSLRSTVLDLLKKNKRGFTLRDLEIKVCESGYKSHSGNFRNVVYQCVYHIEGVKHDAATGCYSLS